MHGVKAYYHRFSSPVRIHTLILAALLGPVAYAASVGSGAPNATATSGFINAYLRGSFANLTFAPTSDVATYGSPGLIQEFQSRANTKLNFALIKVDQNAPVTATDTLQVFDTIYTVYSSLGPTNAGYPTMDTAVCPTNTYGSCTYQLFAKNYAIFAFTSPVTSAFTVKDPYYTEWVNQGGISGNLGPAITSAAAIVSVSTVTGDVQGFVNGNIYTYSAKTTTGTVTNTFSVFGTTFISYSAVGGPAVLGFPTAEEVTLPSGTHRQVFESGRIEWTPGNPGQIIYPITSVVVSAPNTTNLTLNVGDTLVLNATTTDTTGQMVTNRVISWSVSNGQVLAVQANGYTATIKALAKGVSYVTATSEGKTSATVQIRVASPCCDIGEGAPTAAITAAFQAASSRNRLALALPNPTPVVRTAGGYTQQLTTTTGATVFVGESDKSTFAYVLQGAIYMAYASNGGFGGALGYPATDASSGGTQLFESGAALAGTPVQVVPAAVLTKWAALGYETGPLGTPASMATPFKSSMGSSGFSQVFGAGTIYAVTGSGSYVSSGLILTRYSALSGPAGALGAPTSDVFVSSGVSRQNFENGYIDLQPGANAAVEHINPRRPTLTATPLRLVPGGRVHLAIAGFAPGATLTVSQTGAADFTAPVPAGSFGWDVVVPATASAGAFAVTAKDKVTGDTASATYSVVSLPSLAPSFTAISGDGQTSAPGSLLPLPLKAVLKDISGNPLAGIPVFAAASPGASVQASSVTDANGIATATARLPLSGLAIISLTSGGKVATFSAAAAGVSVPGVPVLSQQDSSTIVGTGTQTIAAKGSLLTSLAELILYYQNKGQLASPNGLATPQALNSYLTTHQGYAVSDSGDFTPNPWVATSFTGLRGGVSVETPTATRLADIIASGNPAILGLSLNVDGAPAGMTYVVASGIAADGTIQITDSAFAQTSLTAYAAGFTASSHSISGALAVMFQLSPASVQPAGFVVSAPSAAVPSVAGPSEICGPGLTLGDVYVPGAPAPSTPGAAQFLACTGTQNAYQMSFTKASSAASIYDFQSSTAQPVQASSGSVYTVTRTATGLTLTPLSTAISAVVNSASFSSGITAGGLATVFGAGLNTVSGAQPSVTIGSAPAYVYAAFPFQLNLQIPATLPAGPVSLTVAGPFGSATQMITLANTAPAIFGVGTAPSGLPYGAIANQNGDLNSPGAPAQRGEFLIIYCTGLGAKVKSGDYQVAQVPVKAVINGQEITPGYAGLSPALIGVDQVNVQIPTNLAPSLTSSLLLRQAGQDSTPVQVSIQ